MNINAEEFLESFKIEDGVVGQIGHGYIGNAVYELFKPHCKVLVYDKFKTGELYVSLSRLVSEAHVIFIAVPTPMKSSGECHTGYIEEVLQDVQNEALRVGRDLSEFIVVIKSTIPPGFTARMDDRFALRIAFSPEFLTEANSVQDFKRTNRVIIGGDIDDARVVYKFFSGVWSDRIPENYVDHPDGPVYIIHCNSTAAEMVKLSTNAHLMARVLLSNELFLICEALGVDYEEVKKLTQLDKRIGLSHMNVPGPDGNLGAGGHCFPKDINNLRFVSSQLGTGEKLFTAIHERNLEVRKDHDWEAMKGRAVVDD